MEYRLTESQPSGRARSHATHRDSSLTLLREPDLAPCSWRLCQKRTQRVEHLAKVFVVPGYFTFQRIEALRDLGVSACLLPQADERPDHEDAHLDRTRAVQDGGCHDGTVLRQDPWRVPPPATPLL